MRLAIALLFVSLVAAQAPSESERAQRGMVETPVPAMAMDMPDGMNSTQCIFRPEDKTVSCRGPVETIECPAICDTSILGEKHSNKYSVFGVGMQSEGARVEGRVETIRYWLYPRKLDNSSYLNHSVVADNGRVVDIVVGCGERFVDVAGLRISDCRCYERLVRMFDEAARLPHMARLETEPTIVQEIPLIGEVLVLDKHVQKRWLWGYGWGGLGGWGWGGLGLGWPYYGGWGWGK